MRTPTTLALSAFLLALSAQAQFTDDFSDGEFITFPAWSGSDALFLVDAGSLRSNSPGAATYALSTPSALASDVQWQWRMDLRFATSGANYVDVFLMSDVQDVTATEEGYFVRMGGTADRLELFKRSGGTTTALIASADGIVNSSTSNPFVIRVTRDATDNWTLLFDDGAGGTFTSAGTAVDGTVNTSSFFGLSIVQSSAAGPVNNHWFDDFQVGAIVTDTEPPTISAVEVVSTTLIDVIFSEALDATSANTETNYDVQPFISATSSVLDGVDPARVHLVLSAPLINGNSYTLVVSDVADITGNAIGSASFPFTYSVPEEAQPGDVVINEIMADPAPLVGLPEAEFIELYNAGAATYELGGWTISDGGSNGALPAFQLAPGAHVILASTASAPLFSAFGPVLAVPSFPSLNNDGDPLELRSGAGTTIDAVTFALAWYNDAVKDDGGWTLERIDPTTPCSTASNWTASTDLQGGTPGAQNSVFAIVPDVTAPTLINVFVNSDTEIELQFSEAMSGAGLLSGNYAFVPAISVDLAVPVGDDRLRFTLAAPLVLGQLYTVSVANVTDCVGNAIAIGAPMTFALPEPVLPGDVVINEVLYDPAGSGSDFVELYNRSSKVLGLAGWKLANVTSGAIANATVITNAAFLLMPGQYVLVTEDANGTMQQYPQGHADRFVQAQMPSYNNGEGTVVLQDPAGTTLDRFDYTDDLHFELLNSTAGVSLERVSPERPTSDPSNWHSAAEDAGRATPGFRNSQFAPLPAARGELTIEPAIFSPDNDGHQDLLTMSYRFDAPGSVATMKIFDVAGREVRTLMNNELLGTEGAISWNGMMETNELARMGPYVVYLEAYDLDGNLQRFRKTVVLAHRLD